MDKVEIKVETGYWRHKPLDFLGREKKKKFV